MNTIFGGSELQAYVTDPLVQQIEIAIAGIDEAIQGALDKIVGEGGEITYQAKPLNETSTAQPNTGPIVMNDQQITDLATVPDLTVDGILGFG